MRRTGVLLGLALAAASPALAQSNQGAFGLDAFVAPTTGLGFSYYITDGLSLRPWLGLGYSDYSGFYANVGAQLRYEFRADSRLSPYLSATAQYSHYGNSGVTQGATTGTPRTSRWSSRATSASSARARDCATASRGASPSSPRAA